ncbi:hypothetical protein UlMin_030001 [Ulmus minor]
MKVWKNNFVHQFHVFESCILHFPVISFDTEFPGFVRDTPRRASEDTIYNDMKYNVDNLKVIQLGMTLSDESGNIGGTWEFNFSDFDEKIDAHEHSSINFLKNNDLNLDEIKENGIPIAEFSNKFIQVLRSNQELRWVTFHGNYDLAYLLKLVTRKSMPSSVSEFAKINGEIFGEIYDVKYMARFHHELVGREIGLERMSKIFKVERRGGAHHAGSDSLVTSKIFHKMINSFSLVISEYEGFLYGISNRCMRRPMIVMGRSIGRCPPVVMGYPVVPYYRPIVILPRPCPRPTYDFSPVVVPIPQFY